MLAAFVAGGAFPHHRAHGVGVCAREVVAVVSVAVGVVDGGIVVNVRCAVVGWVVIPGSDF